MTSIIRPSFTNNNQRQLQRWHGYATTSLLEQAAVDMIMNAAQHAISDHKVFFLVLAGGTTPRRVYELLRHKITDWSAWHIYFGDERCLPGNDAERNSQMAAHAWLNHVPIPPEQIHIIPAELGATAASQAYAHLMKPVGMFDLVLLGLGEDGHTASLFPGQEWGSSPDSPAALAVFNAPKPPPERVSLSAWRLGQTHQLMFLVTGATKQQAITEWKNGSKIPAAAIKPINGVDIFVEDALL
jgi:6-phosphogluconolactonase